MTPEEIKSWQESLANGKPSRLSEKAINLANAAALVEIALQLAILNAHFAVAAEAGKPHVYNIPGIDGCPPMERCPRCGGKRTQETPLDPIAQSIPCMHPFHNPSV